MHLLTFRQQFMVILNLFLPNIYIFPIEHSFGAMVNYEGNLTIIAGQTELSDTSSIETLGKTEWIHTSNLPIKTSTHSAVAVGRVATRIFSSVFWENVLFLDLIVSCKFWDHFIFALFYGLTCNTVCSIFSTVYFTLF